MLSWLYGNVSRSQEQWHLRNFIQNKLVEFEQSTQKTIQDLKAQIAALQQVTLLQFRGVVKQCER